MLTPGQQRYLDSLSPAELDRIVTITPWDPKTKEIADSVIDEIRKQVPDLPIELTGSAALEIAGEKDIDISVFCPVSEQINYYTIFEQLFGQPCWQGPSHRGWKIKRDDYEVGIWLVDKDQSTTIQASKRLFAIFEAHPELLKEYEALKLAMNGKTYMEYQTAKYEFYNRILDQKEL